PAHTSTLFPYTTLFRSQRCIRRADQFGVVKLPLVVEGWRADGRDTECHVYARCHELTDRFGDNFRRQTQHKCPRKRCRNVVTLRSEEHTSELQSLAYLV